MRASCRALGLRPPAARPPPIALRAGGAGDVGPADRSEYGYVDLWWADAPVYERRSMVKVARLAVPEVGSRASSGRAWKLWLARHSQGEAGPLGA